MGLITYMWTHELPTESGMYFIADKTLFDGHKPIIYIAKISSTSKSTFTGFDEDKDIQIIFWINCIKRKVYLSSPSDNIQFMKFEGVLPKPIWK